MRVHNVLYVIWALETGGAEQVVIALAKGLDRARYRPVVCCLNQEGALAGSLAPHGIKVISLDKKPGFSPSIIPKIRRVIREEQIDLVHTHLWTSNFWGRIAARLTEVKAVVSTEHNVDVWKSPYHFIADRCLATVSDKVVYVSDCVKSFYVSKTGIDAPKGLRIYNGIDTEAIRPEADPGKLRAELGIPRGAPVLVTVGRLVPQKGHRILVEAMRHVREAIPDAVALIVGEGECGPDLEKQVAESGMQDAVRLTGLRHDIPDLLGMSDLFVLSSYREGFPITILEAMSVGRPCVVTDVGGNREAVLDGATGLICEPDDPEGLARAIQRVLDDASLREKMGLAARERVEQLFSVQVMASQTEKLYEELLLQ